MIDFPIIQEGPPVTDFRTSYLSGFWSYTDEAIAALEEIVYRAMVRFYLHNPGEKSLWKRTAGIQVIVAELLKEAAPSYVPPDLFDWVDKYPGESFSRIHWEEIAASKMEILWRYYGFRW